jgi:hypothetical protein
MLRFSTPASTTLVEAIGGEVSEREHGLTLFSTAPRDAVGIVADLTDRGYAVRPGWPKGLMSEPRGYATASAHLRR